MIVIIDAILSGMFVRGVSNYTNQLLTEYAIQDKKDEFFIFYGSWMKDYDFLKIKQDNFHFIECNPPKGKLLRNFYKCFVLPCKANRFKPNVYHVTDTSPLLYHLCPTVSTIHDLAEYTVPEKYGRFQATFRKLYLPFQIRNSHRILTVSDYSKQTLIDRFKVKPGRVVVTYNGIGMKETDMCDEILYENRRYFICVSALEKSKNVITLVKAYSLLPDNIRRKYSLKLVGYKSTEFEEIDQFIKLAGIENQVDICDYVTKEKLQEFYSYALALVFPSLYEGFGMPIAESFYYNTPVIASDASCFPEICKGSALMFEALDASACANQMLRLATDPNIWEEYRQKGRERLKAFSWKKTAAKTLDVYRSLCHIQNKKKILYIVEALGGGVYYEVLELVNHFSDNFDVYVLYAPRKELPEDYLQSFAPSVKLLRYPTEVVNEKCELNHFKGIKYTRSIIKKVRPDIIHMHSSVAGAWGRLAFFRTPSRMIYTPHGYAYLNGTPASKMKVYKIVEQVLARKTCITAACGRQEYEIAKKFSKNAVLIENGIKDIHNDITVKKDDNVFTVVTIGRVCTQKNPELFNKIALELKDIRFIWCGDSNDKCFTAPNIVSMPFLPHEEVIKLILKSDVFLLTSVFEGLSLSLLEAMSCGKACVVSKTYGNTEVIKHEHNGLLCSTYKDYIDSILRIKNNKNDVSIIKLEKNAIKTVKNNYSLKTTLDKYMKLYLG